MTQLAKDMTSRSLAFEGPMGGYLAPVLAIYQVEVVDFDALVRAVASGNPVAERDAARQLGRDARRKARLTQHLMAQVRQTYGNAFADHFAGV